MPEKCIQPIHKGHEQKARGKSKRTQKSLKKREMGKCIDHGKGDCEEGEMDSKKTSFEQGS